jgi:hypothetical protein
MSSRRFRRFSALFNAWGLDFLYLQRILSYTTTYTTLPLQTSSLVCGKIKVRVLRKCGLRHSQPAFVGYYACRHLKRPMEISAATLSKSTPALRRSIVCLPPQELCHVLVCRSEQLVLPTHLVFQSRRNLKSLLLNACWENKSDAFTSKLDSLYRAVLTALLIVQSCFSADHTSAVTLFPAREQVRLERNVF